jgi:hypothetical protein
MQLMQPLIPDPGAPLARANPVAKLAGALILMAVLFVAVDPLTPALVLVAEIGAVGLSGLRPATLAARFWPLGIAAIDQPATREGLARCVVTMPRDGGMFSESPDQPRRCSGGRAPTR